MYKKKASALFTFICKLIAIFLIIGVSTTAIDYYRLTNNELPLFAITDYNTKTRLQQYRGLFYLATRRINILENENISDSSYLRFTIFIFEIPIEVKNKPVNYEFNIETTENLNCQEPSKLYYYDDTLKIYTYCLNDIKITKKKKKEDLSNYLKTDTKVMDKIFNNLYYGTTINNIELYQDAFGSEFTNNGISYIKCPNNNIYLGPRSLTFQPDFCTDKNDIPVEEPPVEEPQTNVEE